MKTGDIVLSRRLYWFVMLAMLVSLLGRAAACASKTQPAAITALSHDTLAAAQDLEVNLCFGVADAYAVASIADKTHCTSPVAAQIGLTDEKHKAIERGLAEAFQLHRTVNALAASGGKPDLAALNQAIQGLLSILQTLQQTPSVVQLTSLVRAGGK